MTEREIKTALARKHKYDFYLDAVKTGPTWGTNFGLRIIDFWAMKKSWSRMCFTAYEIKVSRSDFKADIKWPEYLKFCHKFLFACPNGLIQPVEIDKDVGLIWVCPETLSTRIVKYPKYRGDIEPDALMLMYVLMNKVNPEIREQSVRTLDDDGQEVLSM